MLTVKGKFSFSLAKAKFVYIYIYIYIQNSPFLKNLIKWWRILYIFFICLRLFWALDVKFRRYYRIRWIIMDLSLVFPRDIIVHLFSIFKLIPCYNLDGWIWAKNSPNRQIIKTPLFVEECVLHWMLRWHNWKKCQVISFANLRQHVEKPSRFVTKPGFPFMSPVTIIPEALKTVSLKVDILDFNHKYSTLSSGK